MLAGKKIPPVLEAPTASQLVRGLLGFMRTRTNYTGNATYAGSHSASVFVTVQQPTQLTAAANPATVATGQTFTIYGSLTAASGAPMSGETIQLQKNVSGTWTDVSGKKNTTSTGGSYSISVSEGAVGIYEYRTNYAGREPMLAATALLSS